MSRENQPWCLGPVDSFQMVDKKRVLLRPHGEVMLRAHHHEMDTAIVKTIPIESSNETHLCEWL